MSKKISFEDEIFIKFGDNVIKVDEMLADGNYVVSEEKMAAFTKKLAEPGIFKQAGDAFKAFAAAEKILKQDNAPPEPTPWDSVKYQEMLVQYPRKAKEEQGYDDHTVNPGWLNYLNVKDLLARYFITIHANYGKVLNWRDMCIGITSIDCDSGLHMPMFDYDGKNIKTKVKKDVKQLQSVFKLGNATIYETRRGLHVYFFSDMVCWADYRKMLDAVNCCKGFQQSTENHEYAVLRVSAKYTEFDILPYKVVISPHRGSNRPGRKAALVQELLRQGQECGTHIASLYPQWAYYQEDESPWKVAKRPAKRVKKVSKQEYLENKAYAVKAKADMKAKYQEMYNNPMKKANNYSISPMSNG